MSNRQACKLYIGAAEYRIIQRQDERGVPFLFTVARRTWYDGGYHVATIGRTDTLADALAILLNIARA